MKSRLKEFFFYVFPDFLKTKALAYHEAGHAIACCRLKLPISKVTIIEQEDCLGYVDHPENWKQNIRKRLNGEDDEKWKNRIQTLIQNSIVEKFCGGIAEQKYRGYPNRHGMKSGLASIDTTLTLLNIRNFFDQNDIGRAKIFRENCYNIASQLVEDPVNWRAIEAIAEMLLKSKELSEIEILKIINCSENG
jgi:hypothetical protein